MNNIKISNANRDELLDFIKVNKRKGKFSVIDVGGSVYGWSASVVDAIVDFNKPVENYNKNIKFFKCDITHPDSWKPILDFVAENGKFEFSICSHTLEDIMNPGYVCEQLSKIAKAGYIAVPSKYKELSKYAEGMPYRGYIHHRWIFTIINNEFVGFPKINFIEYFEEFDKISDNSSLRSDLSFYWQDKIVVKYINNNYLGPNKNAVIQYYEALCDKDDFLFS
jgi:hypothetical protein